jgi:ketosteroid isomerase-like protein
MKLRDLLRIAQLRHSSASRACRIAAATMAFTLLFPLVCLVTGQPQSSPATAEQTKVVEAINTLFAALREENAAKFDSVVSPDFYSFDGGARFNGDRILALIKSLHAAGKQYEWNVTEPDVHINGDAAWIAYVNKGSITDSSGTKSQRWLESAFLQKQGGAWKIVFVHSTRVPNPAQ